MAQSLASRSYDAPSWLVWVALWVVYIVWGSTYLAIRVVVETMPPFLAMGVRFLVAGALMYAFLWLRRGRAGMKTTWRQRGAAGLVGAALLLGGNGMVAVGEQHVPSALTALIIASVPLWVVLLRKFTGDSVQKATLVSVAVGFAGVAVLALSSGSSGSAAALGVALVVAASLSWALGSFYSKFLPLPSDPFVSTAWQMLLGGVALAVAGGVTGEIPEFELSTFSVASMSGVAYLIFIGSILAFTAYTWLLQNAPISKVATYAYVNPVVAVFLGWAILSERVTPAILVGATIIVASVAFTVRRESSPPPVEEQLDHEEERLEPALRSD